MKTVMRAQAASPLRGIGAPRAKPHSRDLIFPRNLRVPQKSLGTMPEIACAAAARSPLRVSGGATTLAGEPKARPATY
jgi:hypothetical protein